MGHRDSAFVHGAENVPAAAVRAKAPVFVVGSPRSGTTLLYHMLLSAGGFAVYRSETHVFNVLEPAFGNLGKIENRRKLMKAWLESRLFRVSGLDAKTVEASVLEDCANGGDFLRIVMGGIARQQGVERWTDCTPDHLLYMQRIKETIPDALVVHIIRDGRDVAMSMDKQRWIRPLPGDKGQHLLVSGLYWDWVTERGRREGRALGADYCEVRFEDLVKNPHQVLGELGSFIGQELNYDRILEVGIGSVSKPNSSFQSNDDWNPVGRWQKVLSSEEATNLEFLIGDTLKDCGYQLTTAAPGKPEQGRLRRMRTRYKAYFDFKLWAKSRAPFGRWFVVKDLSKL